MSIDTRFRFNKKSLEHLPLPQPGSRFTFHDLEVPGLQLRVTDRDIKSFCVFRRSKRGAPERITIGRFPTLSVERARVKARRYLADLGEGVSVVAHPERFHEKGGTLPAVQELVERFEALRFDWTEEATQVTSLQPTHGPW